MSIKNITDLNVFNLSREFVSEIYKVTKGFPSDEKFGLTSQIRRASVSIAANIAEGFGKYTLKEKIYYYRIVTGSISEVQALLLISNDIKYINTHVHTNMSTQLESIYKMVNKIISILQQKMNK